MPRPQPAPAYAPQYSRQERWRALALSLLFIVPVISLLQFVFFPWLRDFSAHADCRSLFGISGHSFVFSLTLAGLPLLLSLASIMYCLPQALKIFAGGQFPPAGAKTYRPTRIRTGRMAYAIAWLHIAFPLCLLLLALWGGVQAHALMQQLHDKYPDGVPCTSETLSQK